MIYLATALIGFVGGYGIKRLSEERQIANLQQQNETMKDHLDQISYCWEDLRGEPFDFND